MQDQHYDEIGLSRLGGLLALKAFCAPKKDNLNEKVERLKEALSGRGKRQGDVGSRGAGRSTSKKSLKSGRMENMEP